MPLIAPNTITRTPMRARPVPTRALPQNLAGPALASAAGAIYAPQLAHERERGRILAARASDRELERGRLGQNLVHSAARIADAALTMRDKYDDRRAQDLAADHQSSTAKWWALEGSQTPYVPGSGDDEGAESGSSAAAALSKHLADLDADAESRLSGRALTRYRDRMRAYRLALSQDALRIDARNILEWNRRSDEAAVKALDDTAFSTSRDFDEFEKNIAPSCHAEAMRGIPSGSARHGDDYDTPVEKFGIPPIQSAADGSAVPDLHFQDDETDDDGKIRGGVRTLYESTYAGKHDELVAKYINSKLDAYVDAAPEAAATIREDLQKAAKSFLGEGARAEAAACLRKADAARDKTLAGRNTAAMAVLTFGRSPTTGNPLRADEAPATFIANARRDAEGIADPATKAKTMADIDQTEAHFQYLAWVDQNKNRGFAEASQAAEKLTNAAARDRALDDLLAVRRERDKRRTNDALLAITTGAAYGTDANGDPITTALEPAQRASLYRDIAADLTVEQRQRLMRTIQDSATVSVAPADIDEIGRAAGIDKLSKQFVDKSGTFTTDPKTLRSLSITADPKGLRNRFEMPADVVLEMVEAIVQYKKAVALSGDEKGKIKSPSEFLSGILQNKTAFKAYCEEAQRRATTEALRAYAVQQAVAFRPSERDAESK